MPTSDSGDPQKVIGMRRNRWSPAAGLGGRHAPDSLAGCGRATQKSCPPAWLLALPAEELFFSLKSHKFTHNLQ